MCFFNSGGSGSGSAGSAASRRLAPMAATDNTEARQQGDLEARIRRRRSGAAANILTSPMGIPSTPRMGARA